jgi:hypothetical protein
MQKKRVADRRDSDRAPDAPVLPQDHPRAFEEAPYPPTRRLRRERQAPPEYVPDVPRRVSPGNHSRMRLGRWSDEAISSLGELAKQSA